MNEYQDDNEFIDSDNDGEFSADALFEWVNGAWVSVGHEPFYGYDEPQDWIEPAHEIDSSWEQTRFIDPDAFFYPVTRSERNEVASENATSANGQSFSLQSTVKFFGGVLGVLCVFLAVAYNFQDNNPRANSSQAQTGRLASPTPTPTLIVPSRSNAISPTATVPVIAERPVSTRTPRPAQVSVNRGCDEVLPGTAYVFTSNNRIFVRSLYDMQDVCLLSTIGQDVRDPQLSSDSAHLYFLASGRIRVVDVSTRGSRILNNYAEGEIQRFDLSPDDTRLVYERNDMLYIYDLESGNITDFSQLPDLPPMHFAVWSADGRDIYFSSGSRLARVSADGRDYEVVYESPRQSEMLFDLAVSDDGTQIAVLYSNSTTDGGEGMFLLNVAGGSVRYFISSGSSDLSDPQWADGENHIAVMEMIDGAEAPRIAIYDMESGMSTFINSLDPAMNEMNGFDLWYGAEE